MSGWHVLNARDVQWHDAGPCGFYADFQAGEAFTEIGFNIGMGLPGQPGALYHREDHQECFFVLRGEALLIVEGQERPLKRWDYFHCPAGIDHIVVVAGDGPCVLLAVGSRVGPTNPVFPVNEVALKHGAGVEVEATSGREAYAHVPEPVETPFREEFVSG